MDIKEYFQKEQKGFYKIIIENLTTERRKQFYDAINDWHENELKLLRIANVVKSLPNKYCPQCGEPVKMKHKFWCSEKP